MSYKAILSLQKIWTKPLNSYGLVLRSLYELFEASKCQMHSCLWRDRTSNQINDIHKQMIPFFVSESKPYSVSSVNQFMNKRFF